MVAKYDESISMEARLHTNLHVFIELFWDGAGHGEDLYGAALSAGYVIRDVFDF